MMLRLPAELRLSTNNWCTWLRRAMRGVSMRSRRCDSVLKKYQRSSVIQANKG
jgi:hypothetical protein